MNRLWFVLPLLVSSINGAHASQTRNEWERCRSLAEASVDENKVGTAGVEGAIRKKCGQPPALEPSSITGIVGVHPYDLVRSKAWGPRFAKVIGASYGKFKDRIVVASETKLMGDWVFGSGLMPHMGGIEEAAFAINARSGRVYVVIREDKSFLSRYGFTDVSEAPAPLQEWLRQLDR